LDESEAIRERTHDTVIIPGLLQIPEYVVDISRAGRRGDSGEDWESRIAAERRQRQSLLTRSDERLELHALVDEACLRHEVGGSVVMAAQLDHLVSVSEWPNVTIQIIPFGFGARGTRASTLFLLSYSEPEEPDEAYVESLLGMENVSNASDVAELSAVWDEIAAAAPSARESVEIIQGTIREHWKG
jgi:hypothetical protein